MLFLNFADVLSLLSSTAMKTTVFILLVVVVGM